MDIDVSAIDGMSQEELMALEDAAVAEEETEDTPEETPENPPEPQQVEDAAEKPEETPEGEEKEDPPEETPDLDELTKHVSPPKKWAAQRAAARQAKQATEEAEKLRRENEELKTKLDWLSAQATSKGVDVEKTPADMLTPDKILAVREEYGDELADMFQAVAQANANKTPETPAKPEAVDVEMDEAISNNNELSYWRENSPELWERAVSVNDGLIHDPEYTALPFGKRFERVVEDVKAAVVKEAKEKAVKQEDGKTDPPPSLSGNGSPPPTATAKSTLDDILNASPEKQAKIYSGLTEAQRDEVDIALGI